MKASCPSVEELRKAATWIRDELDPIIAREGPDIMHPNDVLNLNELFHNLQHCQYSADQIRYSRIHYALLEITGRCSRWPSKLADVCDRIIEVWEKQLGCRLRELRAPLHDHGGRLSGVCAVADLTKEQLIQRWMYETPDLVVYRRAWESGSLGFKPGSWWLNGLFAFRDGIIDPSCVDGGICADSTRAYAIVMEGSDQLPTDSPSRFTYRCAAHDPKRFRLTSATEDSRVPIRVLRSHTLVSIWTPRAGLRYDGLYRVSGWRLVPCEAVKNGGSPFFYEVHLQREENQVDMEEVLRHPLADELDDYLEYKRLRRAYREQQRRLATARLGKQPQLSEPSPLTGASGIFHDSRLLVSLGLDGQGPVPIDSPAPDRIDSQALTRSQKLVTYEDCMQLSDNCNSSCIAENCLNGHDCDCTPGGFKEAQWSNNLGRAPVVTPVTQSHEYGFKQLLSALVSEDPTSRLSSVHHDADLPQDTEFRPHHIKAPPGVSCIDFAFPSHHRSKSETPSAPKVRFDCVSTSDRHRLVRERGMGEAADRGDL